MKNFLLCFVLLSFVSQAQGNTILGTQIIGPRYKFSDEDRIVEGARRIVEMGSDVVKINILSGKEFDTVVRMPFKHVFIWMHDNIKWIDGLTDEEKSLVYTFSYQYAKNLLTSYNNSGKNFYLGHWEGDWMLLGHFEGSKNPTPQAIQGMIEWLNIRDEAINAAKRDTPHQNIEIFHYTEVNRVRDNMILGKDRLVNVVLPYVNVDFVSYSAYDVQKFSAKDIVDTLDYVVAHMKYPDRDKVFIGEFGRSAKDCSYDKDLHEKLNHDIILKFLAWHPPFILYWEIYNNELNADGSQTGFWLIDDKNVKWPLYYTFQEYYQKSR